MKGYRQLVATGVVVAIGAAMCWFGRMTGGDFATLASACIGALAIGNGAEHMARRP